MKFVCPLLSALCLLAGPGHAPAASVNGQNYVALADWARGNGFYGFTSNRGTEIVLTNRTARLVFNVDSHDVEINGVNVRLSFPVANQKGTPFISQLDVETAIRPLIFPPKKNAGKITTVCLDPGHGGKDTGNRVGGFFGHSEKTCTLALALELRDQLQRAGFNVILTRAQDEYVKLPARPETANRRGADLFVSLHFNAFPADPKSVEGAETYCITPVGAASSNAQGEGADYGATPANRNENRSLLLAYQVQRALVRNLGAADRCVRRARFEVLRSAEMPAVLIEGGYMSHPAEGKKIFDSAYRRQMAAAIVRGILAYQKLTATPTPKTSPADTNKVFGVNRAR
jgi:N-acetylmuramoyl-L-alanine amidase